MELPESLDCFAKYLTALNRKPKTVVQYVKWARRFFDFAETLGVRNPAEITSAHLLAYQRHLCDQVNLKGRIHTIVVQNQHLYGISVFLRYLCAEGIPPRNPAQGLQYAKTPERLPRDILSNAEVRKMLRAPDVRTLAGYRDRTILEVLYSTGIRHQELLNLELNDINLESGLLTVRQGKGGKDRIVPFGRIAAKYLETYINGIRPTLLQFATLDPQPEQKALFISLRGGPLRRTNFANIIEQYRRKAGIAHPVSPHTFRHTCATHMIRNRANIRHVQEMLGHVHLNTTEKYLHLTITDLKEAHRRFHPREKD